MPEFLSPGVYIEEVDAGPNPIEGVSTSTAGAVGVTAFGPTSGKPVLVTSFAEFVRIFGAFVPEPSTAIVNDWSTLEKGGHWWRFPLSVKGFFDNGGQRLFVKRVFASTASAAFGSLVKGVVTEIAADATKDSTEIKLRHLVGIDKADTLNFLRGDDGVTSLGICTVTALDSVASKITVTGPHADLVARRGDFAVVRAIVGPESLKFRAKSRGAWGNALRVRVRPMVGTTLSLLANPNITDSIIETQTDGVTAGGASTVTVTNVSKLRNGDRVVIAGKTYRISNLQTGPKTFAIEPALPTGPSLPSGEKVRRVRTNSTKLAEKATANPVKVDDIRDIEDGDLVLIDGREFHVSHRHATDPTFDVDPAPGQIEKDTPVQRLRKAGELGQSTIAVRGAAVLYTGALVELNGFSKKEFFTVVSIAGDIVKLSENTKQDYQEGQKLRVIEAEVSVRFTPEGGEAVDETFSNLRLNNDGSPSALVAHVNARSAFVEVSAAAGFLVDNLTKFPVADPVTAIGGFLPLTQGDDKLNALEPDDFVGVDGGSGKRTGIQALEDIDEISLCLAPDVWAETVHSALILHCETLKDRFAILDPPPKLDIEGIRAFREPLDSKYAALYYPWIEVRDAVAKRNVEVAPSGHVAGIYARVDVERGVHKAPANEVIRGINKIADEVTKREQDLLNPKGINALRFFPGRGNRVWGARTISSDSSWKYVNVRRLFIFVEESIDEGTQFVVFEPNSDSTWARVRQTITNFLTTVWRGGALEGTTADQAFFVKCDRTTMSQDDIDNGRLICVIGIAPVKPAEFVIFRISQKTLENNPR